MKYLALIPVVFIASCASHPKPQVVLRFAPPQATEPLDALRYGESTRAYYVGRFIDPNHPEAMHEQHPVYRIEASARWNLHPGPPVSANFSKQARDAAFAAPLTNDVLVAEMNRQREVTEHVMSQAARLARSYDELQKVIGEMKNVAQNNALIGARLANIEQRILDPRKEPQKLDGSLPVTNSIPGFAEPTDTPRP